MVRVLIQLFVVSDRCQNSTALANHVGRRNSLVRRYSREIQARDAVFRRTEGICSDCRRQSCSRLTPLDCALFLGGEVVGLHLAKTIAKGGKTVTEEMRFAFGRSAFVRPPRGDENR